MAVVCLVAGAFLGTRLDDTGSPISDLVAPPPAALTGGVVSSVIDTNEPLPHQFQVSLFNPGERAVRVLVVGLAGWGTTVAAAEGVEVAPHRWAHAAFSLLGVCGEPALPTATAVRIRIVDPEAAGEQQVELAEPADAVRQDRDLECPRPASLDEGQLTGLWYLEEARGRWADLAGTSLMRFTSDGRFAFDPEGFMFDEGNQGFFGSYRLHGSRLRLRADGGYACDVRFTPGVDDHAAGRGPVAARHRPLRRWLLQLACRRTADPAPAGARERAASRPGLASRVER